MKRIRSSTLLFAIALGASAQSYQYQFGYWTEGPTTAGDKLGWSIAVAPPYVVVGAPRAANEHGGILVYNAADFAAGTAIASPMLAEELGTGQERHLGATVACDGEYIAASHCTHYASTEYNDPSAHYVSIFHEEGTGWHEITRLLRPASATGLFGRAVAMSSGWLAVGGARAEHNGAVRDVVYVYHMNGAAWGPFPQDTLDAEGFTSSDGDAFGYAVAMDGNILVVGAPLENELGEDAGAAYVFERDGNEHWSMVRKLLAGNGVSGDRLGSAAAVRGDRCVVGAVERIVGGVVAGGANVFERNQGFAGNWGETASLAPDPVLAGMNFGATVVLGDSRIAVGAPTYSLAPGNDDGSVRIFAPDGSGGWSATQTVVPFNDGLVHEASRSGTSLGFVGDLLLVGAPWATLAGSARGGVMVYGAPLLGVDALNPESLHVWPLPFTDAFQVRCATRDRSSVRLSLIDGLGRSIAVDQALTENGTWLVQPDALPAGVYSLILSETGSGRILGRCNVVAASKP